jgi:hypothetical protein
MRLEDEAKRLGESGSNVGFQLVLMLPVVNLFFVV